MWVGSGWIASVDLRGSDISSRVDGGHTPSRDWEPQRGTDVGEERDFGCVEFLGNSFLEMTSGSLVHGAKSLEQISELETDIWKHSGVGDTQIL